jgi:DNA-binding Lrp family transcriptional regulator
MVQLQRVRNEPSRLPIVERFKLGAKPIFWSINRHLTRHPCSLGRIALNQRSYISGSMVLARLRKLSAIDKKILKILLAPSDRISSHALAAKLGLPRTTIQRRRNYLEKHFLEFAYSLKLDELGYRRVDLLIYTGGGDTVRIANKLLERDEVVYVGRSIGEHTIDLRAEAIIKDNSQLLDLLEEVKAMPSVKDVIWSEIVKIVGKKRSVPGAIIDSM